MSQRIRYESLQSKTILNPVKAPSMPFAWSINPYRGCQHGCSFCYARSTHAFLGMDTDDTFQKHIFIKSNAADILEAQLHKISRSRKGLNGMGKVAIGTATDPYQPIEAKALLTRKCLEVIAAYRVPTSITTRSPLILRDIDLLKKIPITSINLSINTLNPEVWRNFEPSTPSPFKRLETVRRLVEEGIPTGVFLAPILPLITDSTDELSQIIEGAAKAHAKFVMSSFLRLSTSEVKLWFFQTLRQSYPGLIGKYGELYHNSAYVSKAYSDPLKQTISSLLLRYRLNESEPLNSKDRKGSGPENQRNNHYEHKQNVEHDLNDEHDPRNQHKQNDEHGLHDQ